MPFDPEDRMTNAKLTVSMVRSHEHLLRFRKQRYKILQQYVGQRHPEHNSRTPVPLAAITDFVDTLAHALSPTNPAADVTLKNGNAQMQDSRKKLEMSLNHLIPLIDLATTLYFNVFDALISAMSITKVGILTGFNETMLPGFRRAVGQPFINHVLLDNWIHDVNATNWNAIAYAGDEDFPTMEALLEEGVLTEEEALETPTVEMTIERGVKPRLDGHELQKHVSRWQMWLPNERQVVTFVGDMKGPTAKTLGEPIEWKGPEEGPYHLLQLKPIPGRTLGLAPAASVIELHELDNALFHKASDQARDSKLVFGARRGQHQDANKLRVSPDREMVTVDSDPNMVKPFIFPGPDAGILGMHAITANEFNVKGGNLSLLNGTAAQTDTARQDELLDKNANAKIDASRGRVTKHAGGIIRALGFYLWTDPLIELPLSRQVRGADESVPTIFTPDDQLGDFYDYNVGVNPTSMVAESPEQQLMKLDAFLTRFYDKYKQEMAQMGVAINWPKLVKRAGELLGIQNADDYFMFLAQTQPQAQGSTTTPGTPKQAPPRQGQQQNFNAQLLQSLAPPQAA